ncbi:MAG: hypothetical protein RL679_1301 [Bacteroidota bacterium]|jgi:hypothetical protein
MKLAILVTFFSFFLITSCFSQHQEINEKPAVFSGLKNQSNDSSTLLYAFKNGQYSGHFRNFFMFTENEGGLTDYFANAIGGGIHFNTAKFHGFELGISGTYVFNVLSSDLSKLDPMSGQPSRYEIGLFDQENPANKKDIDRLEEFYLKYYFKKTQLTFGRQLINTPFINLQDGRMRPTSVEGVWFVSEKLKKIKFEGGWLYAISPRGTARWFGVDNSIGLYPSGVNPDGSKSNYYGNLKSNGVGLLGVTHQTSEWLKLQVWNVYVDNIFNSALFQADIEQKVKNKKSLYLSGQFIRQDGVNNGGNENPTKTYFTKNGKAMTFGGRFGVRWKRLDLSLNFNHITKHGRYLFPREWGRDPFFTFLPRERNEGVGNSTAFVFKTQLNSPKYRMKTGFSAGYIQMPDVKNTALNKYAFPSYFQLNLDFRYSFSKIFKGLDAQILIVGKIAAGETYNTAKYIHNKVNMVTCNFLLNYHF